MRKLNRRATIQTLAAMTAVPLVSRQAHAAGLRLKVASDVPATFTSNIRMKEACARIRERTNGLVEITVYPNSQLGGNPLNQLHSGTLDFAILNAQLTTPLVPVAALTGLAYAFKDDAAALGAMDGELGAFMRAEMEKKNLFAFPTMMLAGFRHVISGKPVKSPEDLVGMKIRVPVAPMWVSLFEAFGASPTPISIDELYTALQTRIVDGAENTLSLFYTARLYEIRKNLTVTKHMWDGFWIVSNKESWGRIPKQTQDIIAEEFAKSALVQRDDEMQVQSKLLDTLKGTGMQIIEPDLAPFKQKLVDRGYYSGWRQKFGPGPWALLEKFSGPLA
jgi:tripartite ATP-independent transporter DctP family solute receptor